MCLQSSSIVYNWAYFWRVAQSENEHSVALPIVDSLSWRPDFLPLAVPADLLERLELLNANPFAYWAGHLVRYLLRMQPQTTLAINKSMNAMHYLKPIVGCASDHFQFESTLLFSSCALVFYACTEIIRVLCTT